MKANFVSSGCFWTVSSFCSSPFRMQIGVLHGDNTQLSSDDYLLGYPIAHFYRRQSGLSILSVQILFVFSMPEKQDFISFAFQTLIFKFLTFHHLLKI